jgi:hypothetical protein
MTKRVPHILKLAVYWFALSVIACVILLAALPIALGGWAAERVCGDKIR